MELQLDLWRSLIFNCFVVANSTAAVNIFKLIKPIKTISGGESLNYNKHRFVLFFDRDHVSHFRCSRFHFNCRAKIRIDQKLKYAEQTGNHNHKKFVPSTPILISENPSTPSVKSAAAAAKSKLKPNSSNSTSSTESIADLNFNKDVTTKVELITNDRDVSVMFLQGFKYTKYFESKTHTRWEKMFKLKFVLIDNNCSLIATAVSSTQSRWTHAKHESSTTQNLERFSCEANTIMLRMTTPLIKLSSAQQSKCASFIKNVRNRQLINVQAMTRAQTLQSLLSMKSMQSKTLLLI